MPYMSAVAARSGNRYAHANTALLLLVRKLNVTFRNSLLIAWLVSAALLGAAGCAGVKPAATTGSGGSVGTGHPGSIGIGGFGGTGPMMPEKCTGLCTDFPVDPIFDVGVSHDVAGMFGAASASGGAGGHEPEEGALFPNNWLRPRVRVPGSTGALKITFHAAKQGHRPVAQHNRGCGARR